MEECPKCHCPIIDGETVITAFSIGREHVYLCYECGKEFEELKEKIDNRNKSTQDQDAERAKKCNQ